MGLRVMGIGVMVYLLFDCGVGVMVYMLFNGGVLYTLLFISNLL